MTRMRWIAVAATALGWTTSVAAQDYALDLHGAFTRETTENVRRKHTKALGGGVGLQMVWGKRWSSLRPVTALRADYMQEERGGPSHQSLGVDAMVMPGGRRAISAFVGAGAHANWSGGVDRHWRGAKAGVDVLGGVLLRMGNAVAARAEQRFGRIMGHEHYTTTSVGFLVGLGRHRF